MKKNAPTPAPRFKIKPISAHGPDCLHCKAVERAARLKRAKDDADLGLSKDAFGSNIASPLPKPSGGSSTPRPRKDPKLFPWEKPIPVNTRDIHRELRRYTDPAEKRLARWLYSTWNAQAEAIKYQEIENALKTGELSRAWLDEWRQDYSRFVNETLALEWRNGAEDGADYMAGRIADALGVEWRFPETTQRLDDWIKERGATLAVDLSKEQEKAVRNILNRSLVDQGLSPTELGKRLRPVVGLTNHEAESVDRRRLQLEKLVAEGKLKPAKAEFLTQRYSDALLRRRATRIARTETAFAFNFGALEGMREAVAEGLISADKVRKVFSTSDDERVCPFCGPLDGQVVGLEETFPGQTKKLPNTLVPPVHPNCRCVIEYEIVEDKRKPKLSTPLPEGLEEITDANRAAIEAELNSPELYDQASDFRNLNAMKRAASFSDPKAREFGGVGSRTFIARDPATRKVVGATAWRPRPDLDAFELAELGSLKRGSGVGSKMLDHFLRESAARDASVVFDVGSNNTAFFTKYGIKKSFSTPISSARLRYRVPAEDVKKILGKRGTGGTTGAEFAKPVTRTARARPRTVAPAPPQGEARLDVETYENWTPAKTKKEALRKLERHFESVQLSGAKKVLGSEQAVVNYLNLIDAELVRLKSAGAVPTNIRLKELKVKDRLGGGGGVYTWPSLRTTSTREAYGQATISLNMTGTGQTIEANLTGFASRAERSFFTAIQRYEGSIAANPTEGVGDTYISGRKVSGVKPLVGLSRMTNTLRHELGHALAIPVKRVERGLGTRGAFEEFHDRWLKLTGGRSYNVDSPVVKSMSLYSSANVDELFAEAYSTIYAEGFVAGSLDATLGAGFEDSVRRVVKVLVKGEY